MLRHLIFIGAALLIAAQCQAQGFNYASFTGTEPITLNGQAAFNSSELRVSPSVGSASGSAYHQTPQLVAGGFDTTFSFRISPSSGADGLAFVIHNDPDADTHLGFNGSSLGYATETSQPAGTGIMNALVVEFDCYNSSSGGFSDLGPNELSVHTNGLAECTYGEGESLGRVIPPFDLNDGALHTCRVVYIPGTLDIFLDGAPTPTLSVPYDFATGGTHILTGNPVPGLSLSAGTAYVGFSAASGAIVQNHDITSWSFLPLATVSDDVALSAITAPLNNAVGCATLSPAEQVSITVRNTGMNPVPAGSVITATLQVNANLPIIEFITTSAALNTGDSLNYTFTATSDLSAPGSYNISVSLLYALDLDPTNDSLATVIGSGGQLRVSSFPFLEDFTVTTSSGTSSPPTGFVNETADATGLHSDWVFRNGPTPTTGTGPPSDHTTGIAGLGGYGHIEDDGNFSTVNLRSPCFDLGGLVNPSLRFYLYSHNTGFGSDNLLSVDIIAYPSGTVTTDVFGPQGGTGPSWTLQAVDLSIYAGQLIQIVMRGDTASSGASSHDIAIDDLSVLELLSTPGQAPQPGAAVLDINEPRNVNLDLLSFGFGGPYYSTVSAGDTMTFRIEGEPFRPIILFAGPLSPLVASFAGIGTIDVGGPIDMATGLPTQISVLADGNQLGGFNPFFVTAADGEALFGFTVPSFPPGILGTFQCVLPVAGGAGLALSNAVQVAVQ